ncbi:formate/nitrite transporter family protein [Parageobacillus thermoglucosidasius]|uniref:Transporter n=3 Tax=Anoxybacillaceae TaxID=3120669 RepID=A0AAN0YQC5_PARTM|nr:formate/nitrite transporter family protein [Parageobacillus thermoglucosidasius]REK53978.1 MAG: formate/nitrite transporter family protein [Geobacillus sp.]AEH48289.1 formate/nitrite transporter [Parageobacillus thermoglucosidasius C56-YS93]ALF10485.1 transporter [Parageobacillus thermoglucosidasius]ANZ30565.1 transporter [Parageobacillus thermoglucosidasius]APM81303.1 transporter [Parageobacillus thermoglucosidasius]
MEAVQKCKELALKKRSILERSLIQYMVRAALAGVYIGFALVLCFRVGEFFREANSPATYLVSGIFFGIALVLIMYGEAELFTGNTMYFTISTLQKETSLKDMLQNWLACYSGNLLGAVFFAFLISQSGVFDHIPKEHLLFAVTEKKMHATMMQLFFKGILCNWLVCLAIFIPMQMKEDMAKIFSMILIVFIFFASGYEHSIANFVLFSIALAVPHPETINLAGVVHNIVPVTLGNIVGGALFMGALYTYLASRNDAQFSEKQSVGYLFHNKKKMLNK